MDISLRPGFGGAPWLRRGTGRARVVVAGVAVAGAALIATVPVVQHSAEVQHYEVQLVDSSGDLGVVLAEAAANLADRQTEIAEGSLLPAALNDLYTEYSTRVANDFSAAYEGLLNGYDGFDGPSGLLALPEVINTAADQLASGEIVDAYSGLNEYFLYGLLGGTAPLYDLVGNNFYDGIPGLPPFGSVGVIGELSQINTQVTQAFFSLNTGVFTTYSILAPIVTANFRTSIEAEFFSDAIREGDFTGAFQRLAESPTRILDAFLNGDEFEDYPGVDLQGEVFPGLLTEGGPLQYFGLTFPNSIADALQYTAPGDTPVDAVSAAAGASGDFDLASLLDLPGNFDLASVFDGSWITDLFNPADEISSVVSALAG